MTDRNQDWERAKEEIRSRVDLVEIVSRYTQLKKAGRDRWKGLCPFHGEKTPSFSVDAVRGFYHCFGCKASGDVFTIIQQKERMTFPEAMRMLAERAGVELPESAGGEGSRARNEARQEQLNLLDRVATYYRNLFQKDPRAADAKAYAEKRGLTGETADTFRIGYAPRNRKTVVAQMETKKIDPVIGIATGIVIPQDGDVEPGRQYTYGELRDRFIDRVIFPIEDDRGRVVGFGGRALGDAQPKYLNSPGTDLYQKGLLLYNFHRAREHINDDNGVIIVEGYMDAIAFWRAGVKNVVAPLGTALTIEQAQKLVRLTKKIYLCFDADEAGERAARRALEVLLPLGVAPLRIAVPSGKDPDDLLASEGPQALQRLPQSAEPMLDRVIGRTAAKTGNTLVDRQRSISELLPLFTLVKDPALKSEMLRQTALAFGFPERAVEEQIARASAKSRIYRRESDAPLTDAAPETTVNPLAAIPPAVRPVYSIFANHPLLRELIAESGLRSYLTGPALELFDSLVALWRETGGCEPTDWFNRLNGPGLVEAATGVLAAEEDRLKNLNEQSLEQMVLDTLSALERDRLKVRIGALRTELAELEKSSGDSVRMEAVTRELFACQTRIKQTNPATATTAPARAASGVSEQVLPESGEPPVNPDTPPFPDEPERTSVEHRSDGNSAEEYDPADDYYGAEDDDPEVSPV